MAAAVVRCSRPPAHPGLLTTAQPAAPPPPLTRLEGQRIVVLHQPRVQQLLRDGQQRALVLASALADDAHGEVGRPDRVLVRQHLGKDSAVAAPRRVQLALDAEAIAGGRATSRRALRRRQLCRAHFTAQRRLEPRQRASQHARRLLLEPVLCALAWGHVVLPVPHAALLRVGDGRYRRQKVLVRRLHALRCQDVCRVLAHVRRDRQQARLRSHQRLGHARLVEIV